jgi:tetratricopeptide (TPR) repeat protein
MRHDTRIQIIASITLVACLALSGALTVALAAESGRAQLGYADRAEDSDPPEVAVGVALGAFRGLFVNILWMRANDLKEAGKFHEAIELSNTITRLQPRFPRVWAFHAWNLAYNISVATQTADERWQWVDQGIRLLRDDGIPKNPNSVLLHKELAWIYLHKIQGLTDDANHRYKREVARRWTVILGPPPPRAETFDATRDRYAQWLESLTLAPATLDDLYERTPEARALVQRIRDEADLELDFEFLRNVELIRAVSTAWTPEGLTMSLTEEQASLPLQAVVRDLSQRAVEGDPAGIETFNEIVGYTRRKVLTQDFNYELPRMIRYTKRWGPFDWRHPASHGFYWANRGVEEGSLRRNVEDFDFTNTDRLLLHAAQELFRWGLVHYDLLNDSYLQMVDLQWTDAYESILENELEERRRVVARAGVDFEDPTSRAYRLYSAGYENHLKDVIRVYYRLGQIEQAQEHYSKLRNYENKNTNKAPLDQIDLSLPLAEFVERDMQERMRSPEFAMQEIFTAIADAYRRGLLLGDRRVFEASMKYAYDFHDMYMQEQNLRTMADQDRNRMEFFSPVFFDVAADVFVSLVRSGRIGDRQAALMYRRLMATEMLPIAWVVYDRLSDDLAGLPNFQEFFPEPPRMDEYEATRDNVEQRLDDARKRQLELERR